MELDSIQEYDAMSLVGFYQIIITCVMIFVSPCAHLDRSRRPILLLVNEVIASILLSNVSPILCLMLVRISAVDRTDRNPN